MKVFIKIILMKKLKPNIRSDNYTLRSKVIEKYK